MTIPVIQFTRLTNAGRLNDRFLACQVREFYEAGVDGQSRLMILVEIQRPWLTASQIGQALIHAFTTGYHDASDELDDVKHVELALKRVNETLVHLTQQGETEWIGHLHAVFMLERAGQIHVAQTGRAGTFLARDGKLSRITELEGAQSAASANRTFGNITSGQLEPNDALLVGSAEFVRNISSDSLEETLIDHSPAEAVQRFARILRQHQTRGAAAIVVQTYDPRVIEQQPLITEPDVIYLDQEPVESLGIALKTIGRRAKKLFAATGHHIGRANRSIDSFARSSVVPRSKELARDGIERSKWGYQHLTTVIVPAIANRIRPLAKSVTDRSVRTISNATQTIQHRLQSTSSSSESTPAPTNSTGPSLIGKDLYTVRNYAEPRRRFRLPTQLPNLQQIRAMIITLSSKKQRPRLYMVMAIILLAILSVNVFALRAKQQEHTSVTQINATLDDLSKRFDTAKLQLSLKKNDQSGELTAIAAALKPLVTNPAVSDRATALATQVEDALDSQTKSTRIRDPKKIAAFTTPFGLFRLTSDVVTTQKNSDKIVSSPLAGELHDDRASLPAGSHLTAGTALDQSNALTFLTSQGSLVKMTAPGTSPATIQLNGGSWESATAIASFSDNLYLLDATGNQIWKHAANGDAYDSGSKFITDSTSVSSGISVAIDGSIYVLNSSGTITKITHGKKDSFAVKDLSSGVTLDQPQCIWTSADATSIYVLTKTSIIQLSKSGSYQRRYISPTFTDLSSFIVDTTAKQAWVLNNDTVYQVDLAGA